eukprot:8279342-Alexandrium_andersonii.AAC.1
MSASLVGSEMCIRDRRGTFALAPLISFDCPALVNGGSRRPRGFGAASPVSYTHLTLPTICSV